ncbi:MAG TPA: hypothetical protein VII29_03805 [Terriglobales bacterium]|jgi:hypothetical protein
MNLTGDIGRPQRVVYFLIGLALIACSWIAHDFLSWFQIVVLLLAGIFLLWLAQAGRCEACEALPATGIQKNENGKF